MEHEKKDYQNIETERLQAAADLGNRFIRRWDLYARQLPDGGYVCIRKPLVAEALLSHLEGKITLGAYLMDKESNIRFAVLDSDEEKGQEKILEIAGRLENQGVPSYPELSRRGAHLWFFFENPIMAVIARRFAKGLIAQNGIENVELYPKQDRITDDGPGSLIRLPFGIHRKSGQRYPFVTADGIPLAGTVREQIQILANARTVSQEMIDTFAGYQPEKPVTARLKRPGSALDASWGKIKEKISVKEFVGQYVELRPTTSGAVGKCPFHDDEHNSFGVNAKNNYWHCFAGCGGGDIVSFWMKWRGLKYKQALSELEELLRQDKKEIS